MSCVPNNHNFKLNMFVFYQNSQFLKNRNMSLPLYVPIRLFFFSYLSSKLAQTVKNLPAMQETPGPIPRSPSLTQKGMATHYSILAWRIPWTEEPGELQSVGLQRVGQN